MFADFNSVANGETLSVQKQTGNKETACGKGKKKIVDTDLELLNAHGGNNIVTESRNDTRGPQRWT